MFFKGLLIIFSACLLGVGLIEGEGLAGEGRWEEPWKNESFPIPEKRLSPAQKGVQGLIKLFQNYISPVDGDRCPSYPTCSQYALESIRKHGAIVGMVMGFGRLIHESDEIQRAPKIWLHGSYRYFDPVANNDFWWYKKGDQPGAISQQQ
jgi:putative membrane protein insertion efficiency factor